MKTKKPQLKKVVKTTKTTTSSPSWEFDQVDLKWEGYCALAAGLKTLGYINVEPFMIKEVHEAMLKGKAGKDLPHGMIGLFAEGQIKLYPNIFGEVTR